MNVYEIKVPCHNFKSDFYCQECFFLKSVDSCLEDLAKDHLCVFSLKLSDIEANQSRILQIADVKLGDFPFIFPIQIVSL